MPKILAAAVATVVTFAWPLCAATAAGATMAATGSTAAGIAVLAGLGAVLLSGR